MPEIKLTLDDPSLALDALEVAQADARHERDTASVTVLADLRAQIAAQLSNAPVEEPTGDVILYVFGTTYRKPGKDRDGRPWYPFEPGPVYEWADLIEECDRTNSARPIVYRPEVLRVGVGEPATPPAEAVEADERMGVSTMAGSDHPRTLADDLAYLLEERPGTDLSTIRFTYADDGEVRITARVGNAPEPTPEQVEAEDEYRCVPSCILVNPHEGRACELPESGQQPGVPVEKMRELAETLLSLANAAEYQEPKYDDINAAWREAARRVAALLPEEPTS